MSVCSSVRVLTSAYTVLICKAWKSETRGGPLRKYTNICRNQHSDSGLMLRAVCISACSNVSNNREAWGCDHYPPARLLTLDRWTRFLLPPLPAFIGPLIMLTCHIKIKRSIQCLWYDKEVSWSDAKKESLQSSLIIWLPKHGHGEVKVLQPPLLTVMGSTHLWSYSSIDVFV